MDGEYVSAKNPKSRSSSSSSSSQEGKICKVCGDQANSCNFGAITCDPCKAFFRRNGQKEKMLDLCTEQCVITKDTRASCKSCRLKKCISVGMDKNLIWTPVEREKRQKLVEENRHKRYALSDESKIENKPQKNIIDSDGFQGAFIQSLKQKIHGSVTNIKNLRSTSDTSESSSCASEVVYSISNKLFEKENSMSSADDYSVCHKSENSGPNQTGKSLGKDGSLKVEEINPDFEIEPYDIKSFEKASAVRVCHAHPNFQDTSQSYISDKRMEPKHLLQNNSMTNVPEIAVDDSLFGKVNVNSTFQATSDKSLTENETTHSFLKDDNFIKSFTPNNTNSSLSTEQSSAHTKIDMLFSYVDNTRRDPITALHTVSDLSIPVERTKNSQFGVDHHSSICHDSHSLNPMNFSSIPVQRRNMPLVEVPSLFDIQTQHTSAIKMSKDNTNSDNSSNLNDVLTRDKPGMKLDVHNMDRQQHYSAVENRVKLTKFAIGNVVDNSRESLLKKVLQEGITPLENTDVVEHKVLENRGYVFNMPSNSKSSGSKIHGVPISVINDSLSTDFKELNYQPSDINVCEDMGINHSQYHSVDINKCMDSNPVCMNLPQKNLECSTGFKNSDIILHKEESVDGNFGDNASSPEQNDFHPYHKYSEVKLDLVKSKYSDFITEDKLSCMDPSLASTLQEIRQAFKNSYDKSIPENIQEVPSLPQCFNQLEGFIKKSVMFAKQLPGFIILPPDDQLQLVKHSFLDMTAVHLLKIHNPKNVSFIIKHFPMDDPQQEVLMETSIAAICVNEVAITMMTQFKHIWLEYNRVTQQDQVISMCLLTYMLFMPKQGVSYVHISSIKEQCDLILKVLQNYITVMCPHLSFPDIMNFLPKLRNIAQLGKTALENAPTEFLSHFALGIIDKL